MRRQASQGARSGADVASAGNLLSKTALFLPFLSLFPGGLLAVTVFAQALVVAGGNEKRPVAPEGPDVIHHRGPGTEALTGTRPTEGLTQELGWTEVVCPNWKAVPVMPDCADTALDLRFMLRTPTISGQLRTAGAAAWAQGL